MEKKSINRFLASAIALSAVSIVSSNAMGGGLLDVEFDQADFTGWTALYIIDNEYWPLRPDENPRTFTYIAAAEDECVIDQLTVNGDTYQLEGASPYTGFVAIEVVDIEYVFEDVEEDDCDLDILEDAITNDEADEAVKEATRDWYAQDDQGNIWYLGEISRVYGEDDCEPYSGTPPLPGDYDPEDECFEGSWEAGIETGEEGEAVIGEAGIVVPSDEPIEGEPLTPGTYYMQEVAYEAEDMAKILRMGASLSVEDGAFEGDYENCRKAKEWTALEPGASVEHKWYCPGPGLILIQGIGGGPTESELLVDIDPALP